MVAASNACLLKQLSARQQLNLALEKTKIDPAWEPTLSDQRPGTLFPQTLFTRTCGEKRCGLVVPVEHDYSLFTIRNSVLHGKGLFSGRCIVGQKRGMLVGRFGGIMECGACVRKFKAKNNGSYDFMVLVAFHEEMESNDVVSDNVFWHIRRTGVEAIDGPLWYINSVRDVNPSSHMTQHVEFAVGDLDEDGYVVLEVYLQNCVDTIGIELLSRYTDLQD